MWDALLPTIAMQSNRPSDRFCFCIVQITFQIIWFLYFKVKFLRPNTFYFWGGFKVPGYMNEFQICIVFCIVDSTQLPFFLFSFYYLLQHDFDYILFSSNIEPPRTGESWDVHFSTDHFHCILGSLWFSHNNYYCNFKQETFSLWYRIQSSKAIQVAYRIWNIGSFPLNIWKN